MNEFEQVLEQCLSDLEQGASNLDKCLARHPKYAQQLMPILLTNAYLERTREARPSAAFKARVRAKLTQDMEAYPRRRARFHFLPFMRLAVSLAVILLVMATVGTVYAQGVLPGNPFYGWKLASEHAWRAVSPDPVGTDLAIADRRVSELIAVGNDPALHSQAQENYLEVVARLKSEIDAENETLILSTLNAQAEMLNQSGVSVPFPLPGQDVIPQQGVPTPTPTSSRTPVPEMPVPTQGLPQVIPTDLPPIIPTHLPPILPTGLPPILPSSLPPIIPTIPL